jgi:hypothetical protein
MTLDPRLTHAALQTRIAKVRADAHDHEYARMRWELDQLVDALTEHLLVESPALDALPDAVTSVAKEGQAQILSTLTALVHGAESGAECDDCESLAAELDELFELQDAVERRTIRKHDRRDGTPVEMPVRGVAAEAGMREQRCENFPCDPRSPFGAGNSRVCGGGRESQPIHR